MLRPVLALAGISTLASCTLPIVPAEVNGTRKVVLVHGFLETGNTMKYMCQEFERSGYDCEIIRLRPSDGRGGLVKLAAQMKRDIDARFGPAEKISIVSFSMGGLVSRHYLQNLGGARRCAKFFTISTPHNGTAAAFLYPTQGVRDMRPGSEFLRQLAATEENLGGIPCVSYRTPLDLIILPSDSSIWPRAENRSYNVLAHPFMLTSPPVLRDIQQKLAKAVAPQTTSAEKTPPAR